jgi:Ca-activated chloride channel family protein
MTVKTFVVVLVVTGLAMPSCTDAGSGERDPVFTDAVSTGDVRPGDSASPDASGDPHAVPQDASVADICPDSAGEIAVHDAYPQDVGPDAAGADEDEAPPSVCDIPVEEPQVLYLSADDSNSQASPVIARWMIRAGMPVPWYVVRTYEFLNYYSFDYAPPQAGHVGVTAQMMPDPVEEGLYDMQIGVQSSLLAMADRRPLNITFSLDTSGSMTGGPLGRLKSVCRAIALNLRAGDVVSMVTWNTEQTVVLDSYDVTGPADPILLYAIDRLGAGGSTDLHSGLVRAYALAVDNFGTDRLNRVVLISDGQANTGITDENLIALNADDEEREGIYLVGVGTGDGYDDTLMDTVTDRGKGAYIFIDSDEEAGKMFGDRFLQSLEIAAMDVQVQLTLPPVLRMEVFYGEEISTSPKEVEPQHLGQNDAMIYQQTLRACGEPTEEDMIRIVATWLDPATRERRSDSFEAPATALLEAAGAQLTKGHAVVQYAEALKTLDLAPDAGEKRAACDAALAAVDQAALALDDDELREMSSLLAAACDARVP